jgi:hypothetical protein
MIKEALLTLLNEEVSLDDQLDLLTAIGNQTSSDDVFRVTEDLRHELADKPKFPQDYLSKDGLSDL